MSYSPTIQKAIAFIEMNLHEELSMDSVSYFTGFSKFHFHRIFQKEVGVTAAEYIRYRRIAQAAHLLIYTDSKIIDIAFYYQFESQESFTRSFKKYYQLPPGQYRKMMGTLTLQKEEKKMNQGESMKGWQLSGSHPFNYKMGIDRGIIHKGKASGFLQSVTVASHDEFATMMQQFKADNYLGKRIKLSGFIKAQKIEGFCGFWMRVDNAVHDILQFDNMGDRPIVQDVEWNHYHIVLDVPENSAVISFGALLSGKGKIWIDELRIEEVDENTPTTNIDFASELLEEPANLSFEE